jgi:hypothetical protein
MKVKELISELKKLNKNNEIGFIGWNEYDCEIEGLKFQSIEKGNYGTDYINIKKL